MQSDIDFIDNSDVVDASLYSSEKSFQDDDDDDDDEDTNVRNFCNRSKSITHVTLSNLLCHLYFAELINTTKTSICVAQQSTGYKAPREPAIQYIIR